MLLSFDLIPGRPQGGAQRSHKDHVELKGGGRGSLTPSHYWTKSTTDISSFQTVAELGVVIFTALDYGLKDEEERQLSPALENVIDLMTSAGKQ